MLLPASPLQHLQLTCRLSYGTRIGTQIHQTFVLGVQAYRALDRPSFRKLQSALFPPYFAIQAALPVAMALTYPGGGFVPASFVGVIAEGNRLTVLAPLATMCVAGLVNAVFVGPWTTNTMHERVRQGDYYFFFLITPPCLRYLVFV